MEKANRFFSQMLVALAFSLASVVNVCGANLTWVGDGTANTWDINSAQMWNDGSGSAVYNDGDAVTFDDTGSDSPEINLTTTVQPASVTVNNTNKVYTISGAGVLAGTLSLTKVGTNTLSLCITNTFSGNVTVSGGILDVAPPSTVTLANQFTGTGGIGFRKSGDNRLIISGGSKRNQNYYCGWVVIDGGALQFGTSINITYPGFHRATSYTVNSGTMMEMIGQSTLNYSAPLIVNGGTLLISGSLVSPTVNVNDGGTLLVGGDSPLPSATVTVASNGTFGAAGTVATSVTNLTFAEGANVAWTYDGGAQTAGCVNVTGTLTLPSAATVNLAGSGALRSEQVLFTVETLEGATDLSGWTINNVPDGTYARALLIDNQVVLQTRRGTVVMLL